MPWTPQKVGLACTYTGSLDSTRFQFALCCSPSGIAVSCECVQEISGHSIGPGGFVTNSCSHQIHNAFCCNAGVAVHGSALQQQPPSVDDDAGSVASGFSAASTADGAGSLYDVHQHSPAALFMSPSASFGDNDGSAGYEPTMSPGAFQAAMAAGILAAQGTPAAAPKHEGSRVRQPGNSTQHSPAATVHEVDREMPVPSTVRTGVGAQDNPRTPSSVASSSAVNMPMSRPDWAASFSSADASSRRQAATEMPISKHTEAVGIAGSRGAVEEAAEGAEDPASPSAAMSTNALADGVDAEVHLVNAPSATDEADCCKPAKPGHASLDCAQAQSPEALAAVSLRGPAHSRTPGTSRTVDGEPASTQLAEIAEASGLADDSQLSQQPAAADDAESAPPIPGSHAIKGAQSLQASAGSSAGAASSKSLFSAVSKRPAEVCNLALCSPAKAHPGLGQTPNVRACCPPGGTYLKPCF